jgi:hypothetical protein
MKTVIRISGLPDLEAQHMRRMRAVITDDMVRADIGVKDMEDFMLFITPPQQGCNGNVLVEISVDASKYHKLPTEQLRETIKMAVPMYSHIQFLITAYDLKAGPKHHICLDGK